MEKTDWSQPVQPQCSSACYLCDKSDVAVSHSGVVWCGVTAESNYWWLYCMIIVKLPTNIKGNFTTSYFTSPGLLYRSPGSALEMVCLAVTNIDYCNEALSYHQEFTWTFFHNGPLKIKRQQLGVPQHSGLFIFDQVFAGR